MLGRRRGRPRRAGRAPSPSRGSWTATEPARPRRAPGASPAPPRPPARSARRTRAWVRFCPLADEGATQRVRHPAGVVTGDLAAATARRSGRPRTGDRVCAEDAGTAAGPSRRFRIEVGLADGRVAELGGDTGCSTRDLTLFSQLETTLLMDAVRAGCPPARRPAPSAARTASPRPRPTPTARPRTSSSTTPSARGSRPCPCCRCRPSSPTSAPTPAPARAATLVDQWQVELGGRRRDPRRGHDRLLGRDGPTASPEPRATSYVVVLGDATGTARTLAIDPTAVRRRSAPRSAPRRRHLPRPGLDHGWSGWSRRSRP